MSIVSGKRSGFVDLGVLSRAQRGLLPKLGWLKEQGAYLAGGTGLALYLGHRTSLDFDFYTPAGFDTGRVLAQMERMVGDIELVQVDKDTIVCRCRGVLIGLFAYPYPLLKPLVDAGDVLLASLEDIAAMKLLAIAQRGTRRDFIDCYFLMERMGLDSMLSLAERKYRALERYVVLRALVYFDDADKERFALRNIKMRERVSWPAVKRRIVEQVKRIK